MLYKLKMTVNDVTNALIVKIEITFEIKESASGLTPQMKNIETGIKAVLIKKEMV